MNQYELLKQKYYRLFEGMRPGESIVIADFAKRDPVGFVEFGKQFINEGNHNYEFTKDYRAFRRMWHKIEESQLEALKEQKQELKTAA